MQGEKVFDLISSKSSRKSYASIHDYINSAAKQIDEDQPFYVIDLADILWKAQLWKEIFPNVFPFFAVKANPDPALLRLFVLLGYGFDCSTEGEIRLVLQAGADPQKIIFAHTVKIRKAIRYASSVGVNLMTFDSKAELLKIKKEFPTARLVLRLKTKSEVSAYDLSKKFGCDVSEVEDLLLQAKDLNLNVVGVSFHVGGLCRYIETYMKAIEDSRVAFDIAEKLGFNFTIMDIGAGFFGTKEKEEYFCQLAEKIKSSLSEKFSRPGVDLIAEPGCFCVHSAAYLVTKIIGKKMIAPNEENDIQRVYYLNDGYYGSFLEHMDCYDVTPVPFLTASEIQQRPRYKSKIWGQTCCSNDVVLENCFLPDMEEEEFIVWKNMGVYRNGLSTVFSVVPSATIRHVFVKDSRLNLESIPNQQEVIDHVVKVADLIEFSEEVNGQLVDTQQDLLKCKILK